MKTHNHNTRTKTVIDNPMCKTSFHLKGLEHKAIKINNKLPKELKKINNPNKCKTILKELPSKCVHTIEDFF